MHICLVVIIFNGARHSADYFMQISIDQPIISSRPPTIINVKSKFPDMAAAGKDFSPRERDRIARQLSKSLGPEYLSVRLGCGNTRLTYVEGWLMISLANQIFGFDGWSSKMKSFTQEYIETKDGRTSTAYSCCCRVTLKSGTYKEDTGHGSAENQRGIGLAIEKARKEAATDALKRALRQFGNALGNCCYDKEFLKNVHPMKNAKKEAFDVKKLLTRSDLEFSREGDAEFSLSLDNDLIEFNNSFNEVNK